MVGATGILGGTYTPHCAAVDPARLVRGLAEAVERRGVAIHEQTEARAIRPGGGGDRPGQCPGADRDPGHRGVHPAPPRARRGRWPRSTR